MYFLYINLYISYNDNKTKMYIFMAPPPRRKVNYGSNKSVSKTKNVPLLISFLRGNA